MREEELSDRKFALIIVAMGAAFIALAFLTGCAGYVPPAQPPSKPPAEVTPSPVCAPPTLTTGCYHRPPGQNWQYIPPVSQPATYCPKLLEPGAYVYVQSKYYGQGVDGSPRVVGDPEFCRMIHGVPVNDCHLEGWANRTACELELLGKTVGAAQACPEWEFRANSSEAWRLCKMAGSDAVTCDHHGNTQFKDDPQTAPFEGQPAVCGLQRDGLGNPKGGFFVIAHGRGEVRVCAPNHDPRSCGDSKPVNW